MYDIALCTGWQISYYVLRGGGEGEGGEDIQSPICIHRTNNYIRSRAFTFFFGSIQLAMTFH